MVSDDELSDESKTARAASAFAQTIHPAAVEHEHAAQGQARRTADHAPGKQPFIYLLSRGGRSVLIGNDSGWFLPRTWDALSGRSIDLAILDCTYGLLNPDHRHGHMGAGAVVETANRLREMGCLKPGSRCVANHFSHNGGGGQREFEAFFTPHGIETAYDGLTIEV